MENGKFPGIDGIPIEFYKEFIDIIKKDLQKIFNEILFTNKKTPKTWNQAIITLIPKKGDIDYLKYWRPISLLCIDYKILTKIVANRLKYILPDIISTEQNCSIPNRTIFDNLFLIREIISYARQKTNHFYLVKIDQEKAFDKIDRTFPIIHKFSSNTIQTKYIYDNKQRILITTSITTERSKTRVSTILTTLCDSKPNYSNKYQTR